MSSIVFDIETAPLPDSELEELFEPSELPHPGEFDPASVKLGNLKDEKKKAEKIEAARQEHAALVKAHPELAEQRAAEEYEQFRSKAALSATTGRVLAVGVMDALGRHQIFEGEEEEILWQTWQTFDQAAGMGGKVIGFNTEGFDLPFLIRRSWKRGLEMPSWCVPQPFWHARFVDLYRRWQLADRSARGKLDEICSFLGCPGKLQGMTGADFAKVYVEDRHKAIEYLVSDLAATKSVAEKMGVF